MLVPKSCASQTLPAEHCRYGTRDLSLIEITGDENGVSRYRREYGREQIHARILIRMLIGLRCIRYLSPSVGIFGMLTFSCLSVRSVSAQQGPLVDHHQHLRDPIYKTPGDHGSVDASSLIQMLDASGTKFAVVLSTAYGPPPGPLETEYERVVEENDWTARQVRAHSDRLIGICSINQTQTSWTVAIITRTLCPSRYSWHCHHFVPRCVTP